MPVLSDYARRKKIECHRLRSHQHVDLGREAYDLLRPGGQLLLTSPVPHMDWVMKLLEWLGLNQRRTSPHSNLVYFERIPLFETVSVHCKAGLSQWGILRKPLAA